jgi:spore maturation protein CgeB
MGHEVVTYSAVDILGWRMNAHRRVDDLLSRVSRDHVSAADRSLMKRVREVKPDMVLALTRAISTPMLSSLRAAGVKHLVAWWGDPPANMSQMGLLSDGWDLILFKDADAARKFRRVGLNAHYLLEAFNPKWHRPLSEQQNDHVVIAGNFYAYRQFLVRRLIDAGVPLELYGAPGPRWLDPAIRERHSGRAVFKEEKSRVFGAGLACLNSMHVAEGNSLNCRAFEIAGAAGLQVVEHREAISDAFEPGKEVLVFDSLDELHGHLDFARRSPHEAKAIRMAAHRRGLAEHTYEHRLAALFALLDRA